MKNVGLTAGKKPWFFPGAVMLLGLGVLAIYWQTSDFAFVSFDDPDYVLENEIVIRGLSWDGLRWAFTSFHAANWHPLTWLSHMLDSSWFGLDAGAHHLAAMFWHLANTVLLLVVLWRLTGALGRSVLVAAFFAWHPLRVESVAWIAERKDLLCVFFWLLSLLSYHYYSLRPGYKRYLPVLISALLALLAKPMAVTLPFLLLVLDFWPLRRHLHSSWLRLGLEKLPLLGLAAGAAVMTFMAQKQAGALATLEAFGYGRRLLNALLAYFKYLELALWPRKLAVFYRYQGLPSALTVVGVLLLFSLLSYWFFRQRDKSPFLLVGWLWFLGTLVPVIGLIQVGGQALADRYTYFPSIGLGLLLVWGGAQWGSSIPAARLWAAACLLLLLLLPVSRRQTAFWQNSTTLFSRAVAVDPLNYHAYSDLGVALQAEGRRSEAFRAFTRAVELKPDYLEGWLNLGAAWQKDGRHDEAEKAFSQARQVNPESVKALLGLADCKARQGELPAAGALLDQALKLAPEHPEVYYQLGLLQLNNNQPQQARAFLRRALQTQPENLKARVNLGVAEACLGHYEAARNEFRRVLRQEPDQREALYNLRQLERLHP
ncbi:MAG TPA: tetratricopeptide repeat protein [Proteobacteria bacterium]|mgnify:CR=1 FL=1|nr:tetratricopeptide repeat protein [Pseudomonadota bacterium]